MPLPPKPNTKPIFERGAMKVWRDGRIEVNIGQCARCGGNHKKVTFFPLDRPAGLSTHWCPCPTNHQPILMRVEPDKKGKKK